MPLTARPDPHASLADGILIQGSVRGRLFGLPILKIETTVILSPAQIDRAPVPVRGHLRTRAALPSSRRLADAVKTIGEGAAQLAGTSIAPAPRHERERKRDEAGGSP